MIGNDTIVKLNYLLENKGLDRTWADILNTRINRKADYFSYILEDPFFNCSNKLDFDLLSNLSIGEISVLYEYSLAHQNQNLRADEGQYFTPDDVSMLMSKKSNLFLPGVWIDPCSGIGNLSYWLIKEQSDCEKFILNNLLFVDRDYLALMICRVLMTLEFQKKEKNLFNTSKNRFFCQDYLETNEIPKYDYAILNPPYVVVEPNPRFRCAFTKNTYAYFLEKVIENSKGFISITPQTFTHSSSFSVIRSLLKNKFSDLSVYCFDNVPQNIFKGYKFGSKNTNRANSTRAAIIIANSTTGKSRQRITPLLRWKSTERAALFSQIDKFLSEVPLSSHVFPKVGKPLVPLYNEVINYPRIMKDLLSKKKTRYCLQIPSTPRYFISALRTPVSRTSSRTIYFSAQQDYDFAYLLLNSSYMYWWWRINDGGMTISEKTLLTLPIPEGIQFPAQLIMELEESESKNKVYKKNAGKINENVKHGEALVRRINQSLFPSYAVELLRTHNNSVITGEEIEDYEHKRVRERSEEN